MHQLSPPPRSLGDLSGDPAGSSWNDTEVARQIALLKEERDFLRKYVTRCEQELKAYQLQYPELVRGAVGGAGGDLLNDLGAGAEELPPWVGQAKYMSPLLVAYEARIEELTEKNREQLVRSPSTARNSLQSQSG